MKRAVVLGVACAWTACSAPDLCREAAEHVARCTGVDVPAVPAVAAAPPAEQCGEILAASCSEIAAQAAAGKADNIFCRWFGIWCPKPPPPPPCPAVELPAEFELEEANWVVEGRDPNSEATTSLVTREVDDTIEEIRVFTFQTTEPIVEPILNSDPTVLFGRVGEISPVPYVRGVQLEFLDCHDDLLGTFKKLSKRSTGITYSVLNARGKEIAASDEHDWFGPDFYLRVPRSEEILAEMHRQSLPTFADTWEMTIRDPDALDPRVYVMIGAMRTAVGKPFSVRTAGEGSFSVDPDQGVLRTDDVADSVLLASTKPLPRGAYELRFSYRSIELPGEPSQENSAVLLGIYDQEPRPASSELWEGHKVLEVVVLRRAIASATGRYEHVIAIHRWDDAISGNAFDGHTWRPMGPHAATYAPDTAYGVQLQRTASEYVIAITADGTEVTSVKIPLDTIRHVGDTWVAAGFPYTDRGYGGLVLSEVELPQ